MKHFHQFILIANLILLFTKTSIAQSSKKVLFSFKTTKNDYVCVYALNDEKGLIFFFKPSNGNPFQYPNKLDKNQNWKKFTYGYYFRPGGVENDGLDLNNLYFKFQNKIYVVYEHYAAVGEDLEIGFKILTDKEELIADYKAKLSTKKGSLIDLRHLEEKLPTNSMIYDY